MEILRAVAVFPKIAPENLEDFKAKSLQLLAAVSNQSSILKYDLFFNADNSQCVVLEEYTSPDAALLHVTTNATLLAELSLLGGKIEGRMFPSSQEGEAISEIRNNWDSIMHFHFAGK